MHLSTIKSGIIIFMLLVLAGCASSSKQTTPGAGSSGLEKIDESFDPLSLNDEDIIFPQSKQKKNIEQPPDIPPEANIPLETLSQENKLIEGFRLQLLSTKDLGSATRSKAMAQEQFSDLQLKFYLEFDSPYFKVRAGDFKTREEAEALRGTVRSRGYPQAWIVKTKVWSNPESSATEGNNQLDSPDRN